jgi:non-ribosomal peptide synthetase component F
VGSATVQNFPKRRPSDAAQLSPIFLPTKTAQLDLRFIATESENGLRIECEYATELFEQETIELLLEFYADALRAVCDRPELRMADVELPARLASQVAMSRGLGSFDADRTSTDLLSEILADVESLSEAEARSTDVRQRVTHDEAG